MEGLNYMNNTQLINNVSFSILIIVKQTYYYLKCIMCLYYL